MIESMNNSRENHRLVYSQPYIQNAIEVYYINQGEGQQGGSINNYYENQARTEAGFHSLSSISERLRSWWSFGYTRAIRFTDFMKHLF